MDQRYPADRSGFESGCSQIFVLHWIVRQEMFGEVPLRNSLIIILIQP